MNSFWIVCGLAALLTGLARAETFQLNDGQTLTGEVVSPDEKGARIRLPEGGFAEIKLPDGTVTQVISWTKFSQADLKKIAANPKATRYVQPFIEVPPEVRAKRDEIALKSVPRLERPVAGSLLKALFSSPIGLAVLLVLYLANLYAGCEIANTREQPKVLGCGLAAVVPFLGPVIFFFLPKRLAPGAKESLRPESQPRVEPAATPPVEETPEQPATKLTLAPPDESEAPAIPATKVFARGEFMFNRRFFETKFPGFFALVRRETDRDMVLIIKSARGQHVVQRITRISANDLHVQVTSGVVSQEVMIPFVEVSEVTLKHKSAS